MPKKTGILFVTMGAVLILSALLLFLFNRQESETAGQEAELLLEGIQVIIDQRAEAQSPDAAVSVPMEVQPPPSQTQPDPAEPAPSVPSEDLQQPDQMPVVSYEGYEFIGSLSIPALGLNLPIMSDWDYDRLKIAPCRHFGAVETDDLVIAGHNYVTHFGSLSALQTGTQVSFTDMNGSETHYTLAELRTIEPEDVDAVANSGYDLVLYTCTPGRAKRVAAYFDRSDSE